MPTAELVDVEAENRRMEERIDQEAQRRLERERRTAVFGEPLRDPRCSRKVQILAGICAFLVILAVVLSSVLGPTTGRPPSLPDASQSLTGPPLNLP